MSQYDDMPGSLGYERKRLMDEARAIVASAPWPLRWIERRNLRRMERIDAALGATLYAHQQSVVDEVLTWRDEDNQ